MVLTPQNIGLCADLPAAAVLGFDITPRQELTRECYDRDGKLVITPRNVDLCASLPTAAIVAISSGPASNDDDREPLSNDPAPAGAPNPAPDSGGTKNNKGHGNGDEGDHQGRVLRPGQSRQGPKLTTGRIERSGPTDDVAPSAGPILVRHVDHQMIFDPPSYRETAKTDLTQGDCQKFDYILIFDELFFGEGDINKGWVI